MSVLDDLVEHLLLEAALSGSTGLTEQQFERLVTTFYNERNSTAVGPDDTADAYLFSRAPPAAPISVDAGLLDAAFEHLSKHPDVQLLVFEGQGTDGGEEHVRESLFSTALKAEWSGKRMFTTDERIRRIHPGHGIDRERRPDPNAAKDDRPAQKEPFQIQWMPDLPVNNLVYNIINDSDRSGIAAAELASRLTGPFWRLPLDEVLERLAEYGHRSQPPHLKHLAITKRKEVSEGESTFIYRTIANCEHHMETSQPTRESAVAMGLVPKARSEPSKALIDEWGFPKIAASEFGETGPVLTDPPTAAVPDAGSSMATGKRKRGTDDDALYPELDSNETSSGVQLTGKRMTRGKRVRVDDHEAAAMLDDIEEVNDSSHKTPLRIATTPSRGRKRRRAESNAKSTTVHSQGESTMAATPSQGATPVKRGPYYRPEIPVVKKRAVTREDIEEYQHAAQERAERRVRAEVRASKLRAAAATGAENSANDTGDAPNTQSNSFPASEDVAVEDDELPQARIAEIKEEILKQEKPGVYIDPPEARNAKLENFIRRGRPRKSLIAVIKTPSLEGLPWFEDDNFPRYAPVRKRWERKTITEPGGQSAETQESSSSDKRAEEPVRIHESAFPGTKALPGQSTQPPPGEEPILQVNISGETFDQPPALQQQARTDLVAQLQQAAQVGEGGHGITSPRTEQHAQVQNVPRVKPLATVAESTSVIHPPVLPPLPLTDPSLQAQQLPQNISSVQAEDKARAEQPLLSEETPFKKQRLNQTPHGVFGRMRLVDSPTPAPSQAAALNPVTPFSGDKSNSQPAVMSGFRSYPSTEDGSGGTPGISDMLTTGSSAPTSHVPTALPPAPLEEELSTFTRDAVPAVWPPIVPSRPEPADEVIKPQAPAKPPVFSYSQPPVTISQEPNTQEQARPSLNSNTHAESIFDPIKSGTVPGRDIHVPGGIQSPQKYSTSSARPMAAYVPLSSPRSKGSLTTRKPYRRPRPSYNTLPSLTPTLGGAVQELKGLHSKRGRRSAAHLKRVAELEELIAAEGLVAPTARTTRSADRSPVSPTSLIVKLPIALPKNQGDGPPSIPKVQGSSPAMSLRQEPFENPVGMTGAGQTASTDKTARVEDTTPHGLTGFSLDAQLGSAKVISRPAESPTARAHETQPDGASTGVGHPAQRAVRQKPKPREEVELFDTAYVRAHPRENFYHRGAGSWARGFPSSDFKNYMKTRVSGPGAEAWKASRPAPPPKEAMPSPRKTKATAATQQAAPAEADLPLMEARHRGHDQVEQSTAEEAVPLAIEDHGVQRNLISSDVSSPVGAQRPSAPSPLNIVRPYSSSPLAIIRPYSTHIHQRPVPDEIQRRSRQPAATSEPSSGTTRPSQQGQKPAVLQAATVAGNVSLSTTGDHMDIDSPNAYARPTGHPAVNTALSLQNGVRENSGHSRPTRSKGIVADQQQAIMLDVVRTCNGCFPGNDEPWCVLATAWKRLYDEDLDQTAADLVVRNLVDNRKLKKLTFQFKTNSGIMVKRLILLEIATDQFSQPVKDLRKRIISAYPNAFIPNGAEVSDEMIAKVGGAQKSKLQAIPAPSVWARRNNAKDSNVPHQKTQRQNRRRASLAEVVDDEDDDYEEASPEQVACQAEFQLSNYYHDSTAVPGKRKPHQRLDQTMRVNDPPKKASANAISVARGTSTSSAGKSPRKGRDVDGVMTLDDMARYERYAAAMMLHPAQDFREASGTFSTIGIVDVSPDTASKSLRNRAVRLDGISQGFGTSTKQKIALPSGTVSPSTQARLRQQRETAKLQQLKAVVRTDEEMSMLEKGDSKVRRRLDNRRRQRDWIAAKRKIDPTFKRRKRKLDDDSDEFQPSEEGDHHSLESDEDFSDDAASASPKRSAIVKLPVPTLASLLERLNQTKNDYTFFAPTGKKRGNYKPRKPRPSLAKEESFRASDTEYVPGTAPVRQSTSREISNRDRRSPQDFTDVHRLMSAIAIVTLVCGGINMTVVNWNIVAHALSFRYESEWLRRRWAVLRKARSDELDRLRNALREPLLLAYQNDELPPIDFEHLSDMDWPYLFEWAEEIRDSIAASKDSYMAAALTTRGEVEERFEIQERDPVFELSRNDFFTVPTDLGRKHLALRYTNSNLLSGQVAPGERLQPDMVLRSWARAIALTKQWNYNGMAAAKKLQGAFTASDVERVNRDMTEARILTRSNKNVLPGRNFEISNDVLSQFRRWPSKPDEHTYLRHVAGAWTHITQYLNANDQLQLVPAASDPEYVVLTNMVSEGRLKLTVALPERSNDFEAPFPKLSPWGYGGTSYETKRVDPAVLKFPLVYTKTAKFSNDHSLKSVTIPMEVDSIAEESAIRTPFWSDVHGNLIDDAWDMVVRSILHLIVFRPGVTPMSIEKAHDRKLWAWEIYLVLQWMEKVGIAVRCAANGGGESNGWRAGEQWYCAFLPEISTWKAPKGAELVTSA